MHACFNQHIMFLQALLPRTPFSPLGPPTPGAPRGPTIVSLEGRMTLPGSPAAPLGPAGPGVPGRPGGPSRPFSPGIDCPAGPGSPFCPTTPGKPIGPSWPLGPDRPKTQESCQIPQCKYLETRSENVCPKNKAYPVFQVLLFLQLRAIQGVQGNRALQTHLLLQEVQFHHLCHDLRVVQ